MTHLNTAIVILAAGKGSRMNCSTPKVMQKLGDRDLLHRVLDSALALNPGQIVLVLAEDQNNIQKIIKADYTCNLSFAIQAHQRGTGDAVRCAMAHLQDNIETVLVLYADVPLIDVASLKQVLNAAISNNNNDGAAMVLMTAECDAMHNSYGRIIHNNNGQVQEIVEYRDCTPEQQKITRVSSGVMALPRQQLQSWLQQLKPDNNQGEYYLTDVVTMANADNISVIEAQASIDEIQGANSMADLARLERILARRWVGKLLDQGVRISDPDRFDCRGELVCGRDVCIDINCIFEGKVELANGVHIGANCHLKNCTIGADSHILPNSFVDGACVGQRVSVGPFARIRPNTELEDDARVGNFVEIKNSVLRQGVKASHLSYLGDSEVGEQTNIGAGTITCNYDGTNKNRSVIGNKVFVGSGSMLVAPVHIGDGAIIGAGTVVRSNVNANSLVVCKPTQIKKNDYATRYWQKRPAPGAGHPTESVESKPDSPTGEKS